MGDTKLPDYPARLGDKQLVYVDHTGPASYAAAGEVLGTVNNTTGITAQGLSAIDGVLAGTNSVSGNYNVVAQPSGKGSQKTWKLLWNYAALGQQGIDGLIIATAGSGQTNGTTTLTANSGTATISVTIAGGAITNVKILNPGTYTAVPTFTVAQGGTPGTITATIGSTGGLPVAPGTNLSAETVRIGYIGR